MLHYIVGDGYKTRPNYDQKDSELKYHYIKMKGEATPSVISKLEDIFEPKQK